MKAFAPYSILVVLRVGEKNHVLHDHEEDVVGTRFRYIEVDYEFGYGFLCIKGFPERRICVSKKGMTVLVADCNELYTFHYVKVLHPLSDFLMMHNELPAVVSHYNDAPKHAFEYKGLLLESLMIHPDKEISPDDVEKRIMEYFEQEQFSLDKGNEAVLETGSRKNQSIHKRLFFEGRDETLAVHISHEPSLRIDGSKTSSFVVVTRL